MKRKKNLYQNLYNMDNILSAYNEVCKNTKKKKKVSNLTTRHFFIERFLY